MERETWLFLREREVAPTIIEEDRPHCVVWSSLWPVSLNDTIDFVLRPNGDGSLIRWRWTTDQPPDERGINIVRYRLNYIVADRLRFWVDTQIS